MGVSFVEIPLSDEVIKKISDKRNSEGVDMYFGNYAGAILAEYLKNELPPDAHDLIPKRIESPEDIVFEKIIGDEIAVYQGDLGSLHKADIRWRRCAANDLPLTPAKYYVSLADIAEQLRDTDPSPIITVFDNSPVHGVIYEYGKRSPDWWIIGRHCGRA